MHDVVHGFFQSQQTGRSLFKGLGDAGGEFSPIKWFMSSITLYHAQIGAFDLFISGETVLTVQAFPAAADTRAITRLARIDDFIITRPALGATHGVRRPPITQWIVESTLFVSLPRARPPPDACQFRQPARLRTRNADCQIRGLGTAATMRGQPVQRQLLGRGGFVCGSFARGGFLCPRVLFRKFEPDLAVVQLEVSGKGPAFLGDELGQQIGFASGH